MIKVKRRLITEGGVDPRELPAYSMAEAARYLRMPEATLRSWVAGRPYPTAAGQRFFRPVIHLAADGRPVLSFMNMIEAHVLEAIRRQNNIALRQVRTAVAFLERHYHSRHPLAEHQFETDGLDLFVQKAGLLINLSQAGQLAMREVVAAYLRRIERDGKGLLIRLYPFTRKREPEEPRAVVIDPFVSFGRPVLAGTDIATAILAERFKAGESVEELAKDYGRTALDIQEALRCELPTWEERTEREEATAPRGSSRVASRRFRLRHPQGRSEAEDPGGRSPEGLMEAKGAIRLRALRTGM